MLTPSEMSFAFLAGNLLFEIVKVLLGGTLDTVDLINDAYWFCGAMALVHFGIVTPKPERKRDDNA